MKKYGKEYINQQGERVIEVFDYSLNANLIQADTKYKLYFEKIKNRFLSYYKIKSRESWKEESFRFGRELLAKATIRGRCIYLYLALNPEDLPFATYHQRDKSGIKKYEEVPCMVKVKTDVGLDRALRLIDMLMANHEIPEEKESVYLSYSQLWDYLPVEDLIEKGLVKVKERVLADDEIPVDDSEFENEDMDNEGEEEDSAEEDFVAEEDPVEEEPAPEEEPAEEEPAPEEESVPEPVDNSGKKMVYAYRYNRSHMSRVIQSNKELKGYYSALKNRLLSYYKIKCRESWSCESFRFGRDLLAKMVMRGKYIRLYLALDPESVPFNTYHQRNKGHVKRYADVPLMVKIKTKVGLHRAFRLIDMMMDSLTIPEIRDYDYAYFAENLIYATDAVLLQQGLIKPVRTSILVEAPSSSFVKTVIRYKYSFSARMSQASDFLKSCYELLANKLLSYYKIKHRVSWDYDSYNFGRKQMAKLAIRGKSVRLYLALDANMIPYNQYFQKDKSNTKKYAFVPCMLKIKGNVSMRRALRLIDFMMDLYTIPELKTGDYVEFAKEYPYLPLEDLIALGWVKEVRIEEAHDEEEPMVIIGDAEEPDEEEPEDDEDEEGEEGEEVTPEGFDTDTDEDEDEPEDEEEVEEEPEEEEEDAVAPIIEEEPLYEEPDEDDLEDESEAEEEPQAEAEPEAEEEPQTDEEQPEEEQVEETAIEEEPEEDQEEEFEGEPEEEFIPDDEEYDEDLEDDDKASRPSLPKRRETPIPSVLKDLHLNPEGLTVVLNKRKVPNPDAKGYWIKNKDGELVRVDEDGKLVAFGIDDIETVPEEKKEEEVKEDTSPKKSALEEEIARAQAELDKLNAMEEEEERYEAEITDNYFDEKLGMATPEMIAGFNAFELKMLDATNLQKYLYCEVKNDLMTYRRVRSKTTVSGDVFRQGGYLLAKITLNGGKLRLHLALNPDEYNVRKYGHYDLSAVRAYSNIPTTLDLDSTGMLKYAKLLISEALASHFLLYQNKKKEYVNYHLYYTRKPDAE